MPADAMLRRPPHPSPVLESPAVAPIYIYIPVYINLHQPTQLTIYIYIYIVG